MAGDEARKRPGHDGPEDTGNGDLPQRTETFLGEFRMIIPAMAAIFGFQLMLAFQGSFAELPRLEQVASFLALWCTALAFLLLLMPASYHRLTGEFEHTEEFLRFSRRSIGAAFCFMPFTLALTLYVQAFQVFGDRALAAATGIMALSLALGFWWALPTHRAWSKGYLPHEEAHRRKEERGGRRAPGRPSHGRERADRRPREPDLRT